MELGRIFDHRIERRVTHCLAQSKAHSEKEAHLPQLVALPRSHCCRNQKIGGEGVTAGNLHWRIFETGRCHVLVCRIGMNYYVSMPAWNGDEHLAFRKVSNFLVLVGIHSFRGMS